MTSQIINKGYEIFKKDLALQQIKKIKTDLHVVPKCAEDYGDKTEPYDAYTETSKSYILPKFYGLKYFGYPQKSTIKARLAKFNFKKELRPYQHPIVGICVSRMMRDNGVILSIPPGCGKTVIAIYIAHMLGLKTLVLVHKSVLLTQWIERIKEYSDTTIGIIRQDTFEFDNKDIVVGMIQSIIAPKRDYDPGMFDGIGLLIVDETHHIVAKMFSKSMSKIGNIYTLGLTATPHRDDGLTKLLYWYIGPTLYREERNVQLEVLVRSFNFTSTHKLFIEKTMWVMNIRQRKPMCPKMITNLCKIPKRNELIVNILNSIRKIPGRKIIVLSGRIDSLFFV